jgi:hypothetical protein
MRKLNFVMALGFALMALTCGVVAAFTKRAEWLAVSFVLAVLARMAWYDYKHPQDDDF